LWEAEIEAREKRPAEEFMKEHMLLEKSIMRKFESLQRGLGFSVNTERSKVV
jgi:hypothetical protein